MKPMDARTAAALERVKAIAGDVVAHVRSGATNDEPLWLKHFDPGFESIEGDGTTHRGFEELKQKHAWWQDNFAVYGVEVEGPYVTPNGFAVKYTMEVEAKDGSMPRTRMREVGHYTVREGKVVREEFLGEPMG